MRVMFADQLPHTSQLILGLDRESPIFTVYADDEEHLHVYYGFERLEVVSADRQAPNFKMLVGRLYNSGIKRKVLCETFGVDLKTIRGWAEAICCSEAEEMVRLLSRRERTLTTPIEAYVRMRWSQLSRDGTYGISGRLRQIVLKATAPNGRTIQVAILSDDKQREAKEIIVLILSRWLQENDFKYLDKHFGINQITSYGIIEYEELRQSVEDRQVRSAQLKALQKRRGELKAKQSRLLLRQTKGDYESTTSENQMADYESKQLLSQEEKKRLGRLRAKQSRWKNKRQELSQKIGELSLELAQLDEQSQKVEKTQSRFEQMVEQKMVRMDPIKKLLMDSLRVIARNVFYRALAPFKKPTIITETITISSGN